MRIRHVKWNPGSPEIYRKIPLVFSSGQDFLHIEAYMIWEMENSDII